MIPKVSVLMSVFNECEADIVKSVNSLVAQSYPNVEIIVVVDNPLEQEKYRQILMPYEENNNLIVHYNERNLGLARSMNLACDLSSGEYVARMDADDISLHDRFEKQVAAIEAQQADFVCTGYRLINEVDADIPGEYLFYSADRLKRALVTTNCIHHPTIVMKKKVFKQCGGYRDFPCSQDYDFWLRLLESGCKFYMLDEVLLLYRIRENSTTSNRRFEQACTNFYISILFYQRLTTGTDDYSKENLAAFNENCAKKYWDYKNNIVSIQKMQKKIGHGLITTVVTRIHLLVISKFVRDTYFFKLKLKSKAKKHFATKG